MKSKDINFEYIEDFADYIVDRIENNKDFFVFGNPGRGNSRFDSLLSLFSLKHRMVETINSDIQPINWEEVNQLHNAERMRCLEWLKKAIG